MNTEGTQVVVVGDFMQDIDIYLKQTKIAPDFNCPVYVEERKEVRPGGAGAVVEMLKGFNVKARSVGEDLKECSVKKRLFVGSMPLLRIDHDNLSALAVGDSWSIIDKIDRIKPKIIIVSDYGKGVISEYLFQKLLETQIPVLVDPTVKRPLSFYDGAHTILPNKVEAKVDTVSQAIFECKLLLEYFTNVIIKLGQDGMMIASQNFVHHIKALPIDMVDVCGAGDMVIAAYATAMLGGMDFVTACVFANKMASIKCQQFGATAIKANSDANCT